MSLTPEARAAQIESDLKMASDMRKDAEEKEKKEEERKMDSENGEKIDKVLAALDAIGSRFDAISSRMDAIEEAGKATKLPKDGAEAAMVDRKKKADAEECEEEGDPRPLKADRKDAFGDTVCRADSLEVSQELGAILADANRASNAWNKNTPSPWTNETIDEYRRRIGHWHRQYSPDWKDCNLKELSGVALKNATTQIFKDSYAAAYDRDAWAGEPGAPQMREIRTVDPETGTRIKTFVGNPKAWMQAFQPPRRLAKFNMELIKKNRGF